MQHSTRNRLLQAVLGSCLASTAAAQTVYQFTEVGPAPGSVFGRIPRAIADHGALVSLAYGANPASIGLIEQQGHVQTFALQHGQSVDPQDINSRCVVAGTATNAAYSESLGFVRDRNGAITPFSAPGFAFTSLHGLNDHGVAVGCASTDGYLDQHPLIVANGTLTQVEVPGWEGRVCFDDISDHGTLLGEYTDDTGSHPFIADSNGAASVDVPGAFSAELFKLNNHGVAVGYYSVDDGNPLYFPDHGLLRDKHGVLSTLDWVPQWPATQLVDFFGEQVTLSFVEPSGTVLLSISDDGHVLANAGALYQGNASFGPLLYFDTKVGIGAPKPN